MLLRSFSLYYQVSVLFIELDGCLALVLTFIFWLTGMLETLNDMNIKLEEIQKSLDMYLETKRQIFPRFYFLSNDDLLEILGQSKNPQAVCISLRFLFDVVELSFDMKTLGMILGRGTF